METKPWNLAFWDSEEWKTLNSKLTKLESENVSLNPSRECWFGSLANLTLSDVRVCLVGQDPYPQKAFATGEAFAIPERFGPEDYPVTLKQIFKEYSRDLHYPLPLRGSLEKWRAQGVLLWNYVPVTQSGKSLSCDWTQWDNLNKELAGALAEHNVVFGLLGTVAKRVLQFLGDDYSNVIATSHPSPRGNLRSHNPFIGSRLFSNINVKLTQSGKSPIDWNLG
jgi:uracil-DNA glycosylase